MSSGWRTHQNLIPHRVVGEAVEVVIDLDGQYALQATRSANGNGGNESRLAMVNETTHNAAGITRMREINCLKALPTAIGRTTNEHSTMLILCDWRYDASASHLDVLAGV